MTTCADMLEKLERVDIPLSMQIAMEETASEAVSSQKLQLQQGLRSDDTVTDNYSFRSVFQYGKPPGPIRWYDTGAFYNGILFDVRKDVFILDSADPKTELILNHPKGGPNTLGLGTDAANRYIVILEPVFIEEVKSYLR